MNVGIIGTGAMALRFLTAVKHEAKSVCFVAACDPLDSQRQAFAAEHPDITCYANLADLLADGRVEAVYVATPVCSHASLTVEAARAGKHVLCEKPMALSVDECEQMVAAAEQSGVVLQIGYMMRFHPVHQYIKQQVADGELGRIRFVHAERTYAWDFQPDSLPEHRRWFLDKRRSGGGAFIDLGCHILDLLLYILDDELSDGHLRAIVDPDLGIDTTAVAELHFRSGALGAVMASWQVPLDDNLLQVYGEADCLVATRTIGPYQDGWVERVEQGGRRQRIDIPYTSHYVSEIQHFAECVRHGRASISSGQSCLRSERARLLLLDSMETGRRPA